MLRNFFIVESNYAGNKSLLVRRFGALIAKLWHFKNFKGHVSPHELLQAIAVRSNKRFRIGHQSDPIHFMSWFMNTIHKDLGGNKKKNSSIISKTFQGVVEITTETDKVGTPAEIVVEDEDGKQKWATESKKQKIKFLYLSLELPATPVFSEQQQFDQVPLFELLSKFDGETVQVMPDGSRRKYKILKLPKYLILHYKRFKNNQWFVEKNHTLVNFPLKNLDMKPYLAQAEPPTQDDLEALDIKELKRQCKKHKLDTSSCVEKSDLVDMLAEYYEEMDVPCKLNLIANICHEGKPKNGTYRVHIHHKASSTWYEMEDIHVWTSETMGQLVALSETYLQCFELQ